MPSSATGWASSGAASRGVSTVSALAIDDLGGWECGGIAAPGGGDATTGETGAGISGGPNDVASPVPGENGGAAGAAAIKGTGLGEAAATSTITGGSGALGADAAAAGSGRLAGPAASRAALAFDPRNAVLASGEFSATAASDPTISVAIPALADARSGVPDGAGTCAGGRIELAEPRIVV
jgi:hypothetical protein